MKKEYINPAIEVIHLATNLYLLAGSVNTNDEEEVESVSGYEGDFDENNGEIL